MTVKRANHLGTDNRLQVELPVPDAGQLQAAAVQPSRQCGRIRVASWPSAGRVVLCGRLVGLENQIYFNEKGPAMWTKVNYTLLTLLYVIALGNRESVGQNAEKPDSPLVQAAARADWDTVVHLIENGTDPNETNNAGTTALTWAAHHGQLDVCKVLLKHGANIDHKNNHGSSALSFAARRGYADLTKMLLDAGADVNITTNSGDSPLTWAVYKNHYQVTAMLVAAGADVNHANNKGLTALSLAASHGLANITRMLLRARASANVVDTANRSPLYLATESNYTEVVALLLYRCPNLLLMDNLHRTALDVADIEGFTRISELIKAHQDQKCVLGDHHYSHRDVVTRGCYLMECHCSGDWTVRPRPHPDCEHKSVSGRAAKAVKVGIWIIVALAILLVVGVSAHVVRRTRY
ncbi:kinase D-interacting substrate of 220 kDa B-like [Penaeus monodon]|uniref:kinase D-interacting substrate of 220 kDa B-like n=1 Tax=Penaeus monodon TaxID=6687 RepID=UPI0018A7169E|nr:kinase D-interacting substrate of 220 kDa B-like [Penaeus monodon]